MIGFTCLSCGNSYEQIIPCCFKCFSKEYYRLYYKLNKQKFLDGARKRYYKDIVKSKLERRNYYIEHKEDIKLYNRKYYIKNYNRLRKNGKMYYENNKKVLNRRARLKIIERKKTDMNLFLKDKLSSRIRVAIKNHKGTKVTSSIELLGANIDVVRQHIENQFRQGMSWKNHGVTGWHIDHIIPCNSFDLTKVEEQKRCFNYINLQPLWYIENIRKSNIENHKV